MRKKMKYVAISVILIFSFASVLSIGEDRGEKMQEALSPDMDVKYEIYLNDNGEVIVSEKSDTEKVIKRGRASLLRKGDIEKLEEGIATYNLEEALMMFEDFIS